MTPTRLVVEAEPAFRTRHANPYNARLYDAMSGPTALVRDLRWSRLLFRRVDVVHLHWPALTFLSGHRRSLVVARLALFFGILRVARLRGTRLVWTAHNIDDHERRSTPALRRALRRLLVRNVDAVIALTRSGAEAVRSAYPELRDVPVHVVPHGHYRDAYDLGGDRDGARRLLALPLEATVLVSVGQIRPYKAVPQLIRTFRGVQDDHAVLVVAGRPADARLEAEIRDAAGDDPRVRLVLGFVADDDLARLLIASDLVVLTYSAVQNSGSAILALSADRPVLAPALGALPELQDAVGPDWVRLYEGDLTVGRLAEAVEEARARPRGRPPLDEMEWAAVAASTESVYRAATGSRRPRNSRRPVR